MTIFMIMIAYILGIIWGLYIKNIVSLFLIIIAMILTQKIINSKNIKQYKEIKDYKKFRKFKKFKNLNKYIKILIPNKKLILILITFTISFTYISVLEKSFKTKYKNIKEEIKVEAIVISNVKEKEYKDEYIIKVKTINSNKKYNNTHLKLSIKNNKNKLEYGDKIIFTGEFEEPEIQRNYGGFDYKQYLKTGKIYGLVTTNKIEKIEKGKYNKLLILINKINQKIVDNSNKILEKEEANLLTGILIGNKDNLSKDIQESFRNSNLSHMLAVSGAHVTYVILGITFILKKSKTNKRISKIITIFLLILFIYLTARTPSVTRACIMAIYIIFASLIYKKPQILASISISILIILIINPYKILDVGMQLSYGGTIGIILLSKILEENMKNKIEKVKQKKINQRKIEQKEIKDEVSQIQAKEIKYEVSQVQAKEKEINKIETKEVIIKKQFVSKTINKLLTSIKEMMIVSISANLIIFPIVAYHYNTISLTFFISNILAGPILGLIIILGFITIFISFISVQISKIPAIILSIFIKLLMLIANLSESLPLSKIYVKTPSILTIIIYYIILAITIYIIRCRDRQSLNRKGRRFEKILLNKLKNKKLQKKLIAITLIIIFVFQIIKIIPSTLKIYFIDVGQGDSTLIITPNHKTILIDGGGSETNESYDVGKNTLLPYLLDRGITKLDYIFISHFDSDHVRAVYSQ